MKNVCIVFLCLFILVSCSKAQSTDEGNYINKEIQTYHIKSKVSDKKLSIALPACVIRSISGIQGNDKEQDKNLVNGINMEVERLAFSYPEFPMNLECADEQTSKGASIYALDPLNDYEKQLLQSDPFDYLLYQEKSVGSIYLGSKNHMDLYKTSPVGDGVFVNKDFPGVSRPIVVHFIRFNPQTPNSSFRYYFDIYTILRGEYKLRYTVIATAKNPSQFAEKLRNLLEEDKNVLDYPEVIAGFVENNEKISDFFEKNQSVK